jgi:hypothetical protein
MVYKFNVLLFPSSVDLFQTWVIKDLKKELRTTKSRVKAKE